MACVLLVVFNSVKAWAPPQHGEIDGKRPRKLIRQKSFFCLAPGPMTGHDAICQDSTGKRECPFLRRPRGSCSAAASFAVALLICLNRASLSLSLHWPRPVGREGMLPSWLEPSLWAVAPLLSLLILRRPGRQKTLYARSADAG